MRPCFFFVYDPEETNNRMPWLSAASWLKSIACSSFFFFFFFFRSLLFVSFCFFDFFDGANFKNKKHSVGKLKRTLLNINPWAWFPPFTDDGNTLTWDEGNILAKQWGNVVIVRPCPDREFHDLSNFVSRKASVCLALCSLISKQNNIPSLRVDA